MNVYPEEFKKLCKKVIEDEKFHELVDANAYIVGRYLDDYRLSLKNDGISVDEILEASSIYELKIKAIAKKSEFLTFSNLYAWWNEIVKAKD
ncbi:hypothetical protein [Marinitoga sp. 1138]|uniref:hypothetical protein n=1 Tax=Marinitoga sp. 1138 TaxID=1643334 RepID=UPI001586EC99|nr:hypothetical protein [Marinitoga sp. 1138]NUU96726.1 hypothetical protein [Marinitoga sp. 1138]